MEFSERRKHRRAQIDVAAWVHPLSGTPKKCVIRDVTDYGALLEFSGKPPYSDNLRLVLNGSGTGWVCNVRHRTGNKIGIAFNNPGDAKSVMKTLGL